MPAWTVRPCERNLSNFKSQAPSPPPRLGRQMSLVFLTSSFAFSPAPHASFCDGAGWDRVWSDEFDGTTLDETVWTKDVRGPGDSKTRAANATADSVWVEDGALVIRSNGVFDAARGSWTNLTSGAVDTKGKQSWAGRTRVCVRAKLPGSSGHGNGIWPAHWLMPDDTSCWPCHGEVDIMESETGAIRTHGPNGACSSCEPKPLKCDPPTAQWSIRTASSTARTIGAQTRRAGSHSTCNTLARRCSLPIGRARGTSMLSSTMETAGSSTTWCGPLMEWCTPT